MLNVYQPRLSDQQVDQVNSGLAPHNAYMRLTLLNEDNAWGRVADALSYYSHTATVDAANADEVFEITNIGPEEKITRFGKMRSGSVGDVVLDYWNRKGWICCAFGWYEMTETQVKFFQSEVSTKMKMEA